MTPAHLAKIEARHAAATEGPWAASDNAAELWGPPVYTYVHDGVPRFKRLADAKFIAASWQDISDLLALAKEQAARIAELEVELDAMYRDAAKGRFS